MAPFLKSMSQRATRLGKLFDSTLCTMVAIALGWLVGAPFYVRPWGERAFGEFICIVPVLLYASVHYGFRYNLSLAVILGGGIGGIVIGSLFGGFEAVAESWLDKQLTLGSNPVQYFSSLTAVAIGAGVGTHIGVWIESHYDR